MQKAKLEAIKGKRPPGYSEAIAKAASKEDGEAYYITALAWGKVVREFNLTGNHIIGGPSKPNPTPAKEIKPIPRDQWPAWAKLIALAAKPEDIGVGDTVERTIGKANSAAFKTWFLAAFGRPCGCATRQAAWNATYPYQNEKVLALPNNNESA